ncbi:MAG: hypothetical protein KJ583_06035 [Nanoarchaeota archaeon]|nr:hypothetical protein [Nanoarchaeota archaeon]MBU1270261.1 hypothetical protein [Nanoarchaeota archaeon]MBU1604845.1 hypothetical protein [Nanoarchaeota archaeon]MBU2442485.1 hypothetical protein [Nanoarchaeota archaeon]
MDINKFLQKEIIEFLERKKEGREDIIAEVEEERLEGGSYLTKKDYVKLLQDALAKKDVGTAKNLFNEAQGRLTNAASEDERQHFTMVIDKLYAKIKEFSIEEEEIKKRIEKERAKQEDLKRELEKEKELLEKKKDATQKKPVEKDKEQKKKLSPIEELKANIKKDMAESALNISSHLQKGNLKPAMEEYNLMKEKFKAFPKDNKEEKEELFNDLISNYYQIKKVENKIKKEEEEVKVQKTNINKEQFEKSKQESLLSLKKMKVFLQQDDLKKVIDEYKKLKSIFNEFPKGYEAERKSLYEKIMQVYSEIKNRTSASRKSQELKAQDSKEPIKESAESIEEKSFVKKIVDLKEDLKQTILLMKERKLPEAQLKLINVKHCVEMLPDEKKPEKEQFEKIIDQVNHRLNFLKHSSELNQNA